MDVCAQQHRFAERSGSDTRLVILGSVFPASTLMIWSQPNVRAGSKHMASKSSLPPDSTSNDLKWLDLDDFQTPAVTILAIASYVFAAPHSSMAGLANELFEANHQFQLRPTLVHRAWYELMAIDEVGFAPLADFGAESLFQVTAERAEKAAVIMTTNLTFSECTQAIPNARA